MNIKQAKEYIRNTVDLYLKKDGFGEYRIPVVRQRPIFLLGAPGVGKTAIMEQIAQELGIALVSYSMTHHTRQSALGLPFIETKEYGGLEYKVSEYTMSEIIASIYDVMRESGIREGILFLDEINCVSETLAPSMLQFLQYKVFGRHRVPEGWVIVTAGNPPEYNKSVRDFDVVTMDRLKVLDVEAEYGVWKEYAGNQGIHNVVTSYLELKKEHFYKIETTVKGRSYVTARGWEDLSQILTLYEEEGLTVDETLVGQYLRNERVVKEFTAYYDLYQKYKKNYHVEEILKGEAPEEAFIRAKAASFDERLSLLSMLMDKMLGEIRERMETADYLNDLMVPLKALRGLAEKGGEMAAVTEMMERQAEGKKKLAEVRNGRLLQLLEKASRTGLAEDAQAARDLDGMCNRFEKKIHDLELTRTISMQTAPQMRLVQGNDTLMVEKIQSTVVNTIPLWKSQMVLTLGIEHSAQAAAAQREVTDMTNELLRRNAEKLKLAVTETARESERGIVEIETLKATNETLISTLDEVMQIQREGRQKRAQAEQEMQRLEQELKAKLLQIHG